MITEKYLRDFAQDCKISAEIPPMTREHNYIAVLDKGVIKPVPLKETYLAPTDPEFFLMTTQWELGVIFHRKKQKPVWLCQHVEDLMHICIPLNAGMQWAYMLTDYNETFEAAVYVDNFSLRGRILSVLGGSPRDHLRTFFPYEWQRLECELL